MMAALTTPTRGGYENLQGVLTDASSRTNRLRKRSVTQKPNYPYLSPDSLAAPDSAQFNLGYYYSSTPSSQSPHQRLRRDTSTRALRSLARYQQTRANRSPYDTTPHTPSNLSKVILAEYELGITDFDTPPLSMPISLSLNKKLPPMPVFRLANSPERRGLLDATDLNSSSLQFPLLQPVSTVQEPVAEKTSIQSIEEDLTFIASTPASQNSNADFEVGTIYDASTTSKASKQPTGDAMVVLTVRENISSRLRQQSTRAKLTSASSSSQCNDLHLAAPGSSNRHIIPSNMQGTGSPLPRNDRSPSFNLENGEGVSSLTPQTIISHHSTEELVDVSTTTNDIDAGAEPLVHVCDTNQAAAEPHPEVNDSNNDLINTHTQTVVDVVTNVVDQEASTEGVVDTPESVSEELIVAAGEDELDGSDTDAQQVTDAPVEGQHTGQAAVNQAVQSVAQTGSMPRSDSQTTIARKVKLTVAPPTKRFARDADITILGKSAPYGKVGARTYINVATDKVEPARAAAGLAKKASVSRRKSSLPDSPENKSLKPATLTLEKRRSVTERLMKPTASSAARTKPAPMQKSTTMTSVKNAGKGIKNRLSTIIKTRRSSQVAAAVASPGSSLQEPIAETVVTTTAVSEVASLAEEIDVGEEFALVYSQMNNAPENVTSHQSFVEPLTDGLVLDPATNGVDVGNNLIDTQVGAECTAVSGTEMAAILKTAISTPLPPAVQDSLEAFTLIAPTLPVISLQQGGTDVDEDANKAVSPDVQVASGDGASDPPPHEEGKGGHADEEVSSLSSDDMLSELHQALNNIYDALLVETDEVHLVDLASFAETITYRITTINDTRVFIEKLKVYEHSLLQDALKDASKVRQLRSDHVARSNVGDN